jgi:hypothetical protein
MDLGLLFGGAAQLNLADEAGIVPDPAAAGSRVEETTGRAC